MHFERAFADAWEVASQLFEQGPVALKHVLRDTSSNGTWAEKNTENRHHTVVLTYKPNGPISHTAYVDAAQGVENTPLAVTYCGCTHTIVISSTGAEYAMAETQRATKAGQARKCKGAYKAPKSPPAVTIVDVPRIADDLDTIADVGDLEADLGTITDGGDKGHTKAKGKKGTTEGNGEQGTTEGKSRTSKGGKKGNSRGRRTSSQVTSDASVSAATVTMASAIIGAATGFVVVGLAVRRFGTATATPRLSLTPA